MNTKVLCGMLLCALGVSVMAGPSTKVSVSVGYGEDGEVVVAENALADECAHAEYYDTVDENGWGQLTVEGKDECNLTAQGYAMGVAEGYLTADRIWQAFQNFNNSNWYLQGGFLPVVLQQYIEAQNQWISEQIANTTEDDKHMYSYWQHVNILMQHASGVAYGYQQAAPANQTLTVEQVYILAMAGDLEDLSAAMPYLGREHEDNQPTPRVKPGFKFTPIHMDCSGLVKLTDDDLFVGHTTFNAYWCMLRIFKHYKGNFKGIKTEATTVSFSSRPGDLESKDDFFLLNSEMVVIETSLTIFNKTLYKQLTPQSVPVWIRCQVANRMARNASEWVSLFSLYNSGTHNNEWIVTDYKAHKRNNQTLQEVSWLLDQIPGQIEASDVTELLMTQGYIPSYNIPYFANIMLLSGYTAAGYNYSNDTRAQIFRRDQGGVTDLLSMAALMNKNDYQNDPLADGNPCNQISARCDLAGDAFGGIDSKNVDTKHVKSQKTYLIGAPSHTYEPVYVWDAEYQGVSHVGMPTTFNFNWTTFEPAF